MASSPSLSRLLRFLVEETLAGRGAEISESQLGVQVFHRGEDFNPRNDPIVRVQTHHLRSRLARYYAREGAGDPIVIELRPRTYVPLFREAEQAAPLAELAVTQAADPPAPAAEPAPAGPKPAADRKLAGTIAVSVAGVLVMIAALAFLGRSWHASAVGKHFDPDPVAEDFYVRGRYLLDRQTESSLRQSIDSFQQATTRDPHFAAAFAGLADARNILVQYGYVPPREGMEEARAAAKQALALDPNLAEAHVSLAAIKEAYDWDFKAAENEYRRAISLNPALPSAHLWYGMFLRDQGRLLEALPELRRAEQLEPISVMGSINMAFTFRMAGDYNAALDRANRAVELNPDLAIADIVLSNVHRARSELADADASLERARSLAAGNPHTLSVLACVYAHLGRKQESVEMRRAVEQLVNQRYVSPYDLANVALDQGDEDRAVGLFEEAYRQRSTGIIFLRNEKGELAHSPKMLSMMKKLGIG